MRENLALINSSRGAGQPVYVHCFGGTGRTGTVVGCWLVEQGRGGEDPIRALQALRGTCRKRDRRSPDTDEQEEFVRGWAPR
jgi:protein-tyrosine phosphatase